MEIQKVYVKKRLEFGKQCIWTETDPMIDVDIPPNPSEMRQYIMKTERHIGPQKSTQLAAHEAQTTSRTTKNSGMYHFEGGWPKEINPRDEETTARFRRRVEKDDHWAPKLQDLFEVMEKGILQNGAINLYQHYFDDMVPTELVQPVSLRAVKVYTDPQRPKRPVTDISVSPDDGRRIVVSYCFLDFGRRADYSNTVYVWQVDNPNEPYMAMEPFCPCVACEFNPRDPSILASGLMTGQVCNWDLRISEKPVQYSDLLYSHRAYANAVKWVPTKTNTDFFSTSSDGCTLWWDTRWLRQPMEKLIIDLDKPNEPTMERSVGISSINFGPMVGTQYMCGLENGIIITGSRKGKTNAEKMVAKFVGHSGPVCAVDRSVFNPSIFMSVGDWRVKIWAEDTREGNLISTLYMQSNPTSGCWDKIRNSVFYVTTDAGTLVAWDILQNLRKPIFKLQLCNAKITTLAPYEEGTFMAVGNYNGNSYLVESTEFLQHFDRKDRAALSEYLERCSKLTKAVDTRLREIKLMHKVTSDWEEAAVPVAKVKDTRKLKRMERSNGSNGNNNNGKKHSRDSKRKFKNDVMMTQLTEVENKYYEIVGQELLKYASSSEPELCPIGPILVVGKRQDRKAKKTEEKKKPVKEKKMKTKMGRKATQGLLLKVKPLLRGTKSSQKLSRSQVGLSTDSVLVAVPSDSAQTKLTKKKKKKRVIKFRLPVPCKKEICKPNVCCFRRKRGSSDKKTRKKPKTRISRLTSSMLTDRSMVTASMKQRGRKKDRSQQALIRWKMLNLPAEFLQEVRRAKRDVKEFALSGTARRRRTRRTKAVQEENRKVSESERLREKASITNDREGGEVDSSVSEEDRPEEGLPVKARRKVSIGPDLCSPQRKRSITKDFAEMIGLPLSKSIEEREEEGKAYIKELLAMQARVYPRISEFHTIE